MWKLNKVVDGQSPDYPFTEVPEPPEGYTWDDVTYVIGGYNWKARFIDQNGYIITGDIRTHMMGIDPEQIGQFTEDGLQALSQVGLDFACRHCHVPDSTFVKNDEELLEAAFDYHARP